MATTTTTEFIRELHQWFENGGGALSPNALYTGPSGGDNATWRDVLAAIVAEQQPAGPTTVYVILRAGTAEYLAADCTPSSPKWTRNTNLFRRFPSEAAADTFRRAIPGRKGGAEALTVECQETPAPAGGCEFCPAGGGGCAVCRSLTA